MLNTIRSLSPIDLRNIRRDSMLRWMALMPFAFVLLFRYLVPWLRDGILAQFGWDVQPYYILLLSYGFVIGTPVLFGVVIGFLLLDERDDQTLTALQVTPMTLNSYLAYRVMLPMLLSVILTLIAYPLVQIIPMATGDLLLVALLSAPMAPLYTLFLAVTAKNKVQGFAVMKASGSLLVLPLIAYFVEAKWQIIFGIIPTYWPAKLYWLLEAGESGIWFYFIAGFIVQTVFIWLLMQRFNKVMHQ